MDPESEEILHLRPSYGTYADPLLSSSLPRFLPSLPVSYITFRHPGYQDLGNILFCLPTHDGQQPTAPDGEGIQDGDGTRHSGGWGVHHGTALRACSIIACNIDGFLSSILLTTPPFEVPTLSFDSLLTARVYYFYPRLWLQSQAQLDLVYPVCPSFQDWCFPHDNVPAEWIDVYETEQSLPGVAKSSQYSVAVALRDGTCRISNFSDSSETAHLVPRNQGDWFSRNEMEIYNRNRHLPSHLITSDIQNCLRLRSDIHGQLDAGAFVFVPKCATSRIHFLKETREYGVLLHNRETEQFRVSPEFVYARFAWTILPLAQAFATKPGVKVSVWSAEKNYWEEQVRPSITDASKRSSRKRQRPEQPSENSSTSRNSSGHQPAEDFDYPIYDSAAPGNCIDDNRHGGDIAHGSSSPTIPWSPPPRERRGYERRKKIFDSIVSNRGASAWDTLCWHPDSDRLEQMKDEYLGAHEPLHGQEQKRQIEIMERGGILYDGEALWDDEVV